MHTSHGFHIPGTVLEDPERLVGMCGGLSAGCATCVGEAYHATLVRISPEDKIRKVSLMDNIDLQTKAKVIVGNYFNDHRDNPAEVPELTLRDIKIVWFAKVLKNWKALVTTNVPNGAYYELTYNGATRETYVDVYKKVDNLAIPD